MNIGWVASEISADCNEPCFHPWSCPMKQMVALINSFIVQKMKCSIRGFFSKFDQIRRKLQIWSHLLKKSLKENFLFCAVFQNRGPFYKKISVMKELNWNLEENGHNWNLLYWNCARKNVVPRNFTDSCAIFMLENFLSFFEDVSSVMQITVDTAWQIFEYGSFSGSVYFRSRNEHEAIRIRKNSIFG